ncbi:MAG: homocysteine S-methyltransferase family protein, partial [Caldilineaceae bacterium]|nr:homocysteine S-methyltransferase family protein [Caldilineaceae bacterium]
GTMLYAKGASSEQCLEQLVVTHPGWVTAIHQAYASAGADLIKSHTFGANRIRLAAYGLADHVREFNFKAVRLVRDVREVAGRAIFIAGDVGPLGKRLQPLGTVSEQEAYDVFREQISVLWEAGADLLLFETFTDLEELRIAVRAAKDLCDLPVVASMSYAQDGLTGSYLSPQIVTERLLALRADLVGVNCGVGPVQTLHALRAMHDAAPEVHFSVMPNAGFPERVEGRFYYPSSPEYFAHHVPLFLEQNARLIGGCCGTTPIHIRAMRDALNNHLNLKAVTKPPKVEVSAPSEDLAELTSGYDFLEEDQPTPLLQKLRAGKFVISVEVDPPRAFVAQKQIEGAIHAKAMGADAVNVADSP